MRLFLADQCCICCCNWVVAILIVPSTAKVFVGWGSALSCLAGLTLQGMLWRGVVFSAQGDSSGHGVRCQQRDCISPHACSLGPVRCNCGTVDHMIMVHIIGCSMVLISRVGWFSFYSGLPGEACFSEGVWYVCLDCLCGIS